ncbi:MAG: hypothetical protein WKF34_03610 [Pyrinomonadaceae bacterium]
MNSSPLISSALKVLLLLALSVTASFAQDASADDTQRQAIAPPDVRGNAIRQLGLSRDQMQQIRGLNQARRPAMEAAQVRLRAATQALNESIYADGTNEANVEARLLGMQKAHADVQRIRFTHEFAVRRVLTTAQLVKFRDLRRRFDQARQNQDPGLRRENARPRPSVDNALRPQRRVQRPQMLKQRNARP